MQQPQQTGREATELDPPTAVEGGRPPSRRHPPPRLRLVSPATARFSPRPRSSSEHCFLLLPNLWSFGVLWPWPCWTPPHFPRWLRPLWGLDRGLDPSGDWMSHVKSRSRENLCYPKPAAGGERQRRHRGENTLAPLQCPGELRGPARFFPRTRRDEPGCRCGGSCELEP